MLGFPSHIILLILFVALWILLFVRRRPVRREMILIGLIGAFFTPIVVLLNAVALGAATIPTIEVAHFLFSFSFAGVASVIFHELLGKHYRARRPFWRHRAQSFTPALRLLFIVLAWAWLSVLFVFLLKTTVFQAVVVAALGLGMIIVTLRRDLLADAIWSGLLMAVIIFFLYEISYFQRGPIVASEWWATTTLPERFIGSVPIEALIWAATTGFILGPMYEFARNWKLTTGDKK